MVKKRSLLFLIMGVIFGCLLSCGIFAVVTKSVSFNLALKLDPKIYFALELQIDYNGDGDYGDTQNNINESSSYKIFNNKTGTDVVSWATVNQNCIVLNQVLAGDILSDLSINSKFKITVTNLTAKTSNEAEEYLHLTLDYDNQKEVFKADNGYGAVNMEYGVASGDTRATKSFTLIPQTTLLDGYIQIPFLAEIDSYRYTATITTENCEIIHAPKTFKLNTTYSAEFRAYEVYDASYHYDIKIDSKSYETNCNTNYLQIPSEDVIGSIVINVSAITKNIWDGTTATAFTAGNGSEETPFLISNGEELALMQYLVTNQNTATTYSGITSTNQFGSASYKLLNDIYLNDSDSTTNVWTAIGNGTTFFNGVFDGSNNKIYGMYINNGNYLQGFFGTNSGIIKNVTLLNGSITGLVSTGGICGYSTGKIINCVNKNNVTATGAIKHDPIVAMNNVARTLVGGIVGSINGEAAVVDSCFNYGKVYGYSYDVGGVVGWAQYSALIVNSGNYGVVYGASQGCCGICGEGQVYPYLINCFNHGELLFNDNDSSGITRYAIHAYNSYNSANISNTGTICALDGAKAECLYSVNNANISRYEAGATSSNLSVFDAATGILTTPPTINGKQYNTLSSALNAWVDANAATYLESHGVVLKHWSDDSCPILID